MRWCLEDWPLTVEVTVVVEVLVQVLLSWCLMRRSLLWRCLEVLVEVVLIVERTVPPKERLRMQDLYADRNSDGDKALVMKQFLSDEKIDEINEIIEMKITHRKNIDRRKTRFG